MKSSTSQLSNTVSHVIIWPTYQKLQSGLKKIFKRRLTFSWTKYATKNSQKSHFSRFWLSILKHVLTSGPYVFGSVQRMLWSVSPPNIMVRYLIIKKPPGHLAPSYFGRKFERFFKFRHILVNTKVNKCWPKCFFRKDHIKSYRKHIYSFFIALILFSQSLKVCLSLLRVPLPNLTFNLFVLWTEFWHLFGTKNGTFF